MSKASSIDCWFKEVLVCMPAERLPGSDVPARPVHIEVRGPVCVGSRGVHIGFDAGGVSLDVRVTPEDAAKLAQMLLAAGAAAHVLWDKKA